MVTGNNQFDRHSCEASLKNGKLRTGYSRQFECAYCKECGEWIFFNKHGEPYHITDFIPEKHPDYVEETTPVPSVEGQTGSPAADN